MPNAEGWSVVVANIHQPTPRLFRSGARCYVLEVKDSDSSRVLARSRSGRWIDYWVRTKHLRNPRRKTLWPGNPHRRLKDGLVRLSCHLTLERLERCIYETVMKEADPHAQF